MTWEPLIAIVVTALAAVAGSSMFVRAASERERESHLREDAAHRAASRRGLLPTGSLPPVAGPLLPAKPVSPPMARSPRHGGARLRLRYAAIILLAWALPASPGLDTTGDEADPGAAPVETREVERVRKTPAIPLRRPDCDGTILATGSPAPDAPSSPPAKDSTTATC